LQDEDAHWKRIVQDFKNSPADGIRGRGMMRRSDQVANDNNLLAIFASRLDYQALAYLRAISYRMPDFV
jgi:hypothetical protein